VHIPKIYEPPTKYHAWYPSRRCGERAKLSTITATNTTQEKVTENRAESDYRSEFKRSAWAGGIKRIYKIAPLDPPPEDF
jgi:hypothetical protein